MSGISSEAFFGNPDLGEADDRLIAQYIKIGVAVDRLAYTDEFEQLFAAIVKQGEKRTRAEVFRRLLNLRKAGLLPTGFPPADGTKRSA
jgi:hypothetical protein